jgi:hypothetical protein
MASASDPPSGQEEAIPGSLTVRFGHDIPHAGRGSAESVPTSADVSGLGSRLPPGIRSFGLPPLGWASR